MCLFGAHMVTGAQSVSRTSVAESAAIFSSSADVSTACATVGFGFLYGLGKGCVLHAHSRYRAAWDTVPRGISCRVGYRAVRDTVPRGIPCRVRYRAA